MYPKNKLECDVVVTPAPPCSK